MQYVYWIHRINEKDILSEGYVGVSNNPEKRLYMHKTGYGNIRVKRNIELYDDVIIEVVFSGSEEECYTHESSLRPLSNIGWNFAEGGSKPPSPKGNKARSEKASKSLKGRKITWVDKIIAARKGYKPTVATVEKNACY